MEDNMKKLIVIALCAVSAGVLMITHASANQQLTSSLIANVAPVISLTVSSTCDSAGHIGNDVTLSLTPKNDSVLSTCPNIVTVSTNSTGFKLFFRVSSDNLINSVNSSYTMPSTANQVPNALAPNTWGYAIPAASNADHSVIGIPLPITAAFNNSYVTHISQTPIPSDKYAKAPTVDSLIKELRITDTDADLQDNKTTVYFGVTANLSTRAGSYQTSIVYTAIGEEVLAPPPYLAQIKAKNNLSTMQSLTPALCAAADYDTTDNGVNNNNTITLVDTRNNQNYAIRKLADGGCWMINNLKLGSTTGPLQLTPSDTNIATNWALPQVNANGAPSTIGFYDVPIIDALLSSDPKYDNAKPNSEETDITSPNFAGYYYNWCATKAGRPESCPYINTSPTANNYDICPVNWHLPTGNFDGDFSLLDQAYGGTGSNHAINSPDTQGLWLLDGAFQGTFSGLRTVSSWVDQGITGNFWTSSYEMSFHSTSTVPYLYLSRSQSAPGTGSNMRNNQFTVRCMLSPTSLNKTPV
jgi:uncharacterized protein (TIGR02145 family)